MNHCLSTFLLLETKGKSGSEAKSLTLGVLLLQCFNVLLQELPFFAWGGRGSRCLTQTQISRAASAAFCT